MRKLDFSWLTENHIDFEYKKYVLLGYLQSVKKKFQFQKLYPDFAELIMHFENLKSIKENKELLHDSFPKNVSGIDFNQLKITYQKLVEDDDLMQELSEIINYALPQMYKTVGYGKALYDFVGENIELDEVGLMPLDKHEGYVLLTEEAEKSLLVYRFKLSLIDHPKKQIQAIHTTLISSEVKSISNTVNQIKLRLIRKFKELPNPATFLITSKLQFPVAETLLPVAKRLLIKRVKLS